MLPEQGLVPFGNEMVKLHYTDSRFEQNSKLKSVTGYDFFGCGRRILVAARKKAMGKHMVNTFRQKHVAMAKISFN